MAPRFERVPRLIDDLVAFTQRTDIEPYLQVALAHAQFETIHPFTDGNGCTGRALVQAMLRSSGITQRITVPVSVGLLNEVEDYYEALTAYRSGDLDPIRSSLRSPTLRSRRSAMLRYWWGSWPTSVRRGPGG